MRQELHQYIDKSDNRLVKIVYALIREYNDEMNDNFTEEDIKTFDERREKRISGESKTFSRKK